MRVAALWQRLRGLGAPDEPGAGAAAPRWIVLDVESSGLDAQRDRLLAIAAVAVRCRASRLVLDLADSFEVVLRQPEAPTRPDKANILLHGIGVAAQREGVEPALALQGFEAWAAAAPLIGYHVAFDRVLIERAMRRVLGHAPAGPWLDLAELAPVLHSGVKAKALDEWLAHFGIRVAVRHQAAADALATAELLQRLWPRAQAEGAADFAALARLAAQRRWLPASA